MTVFFFGVGVYDFDFKKDCSMWGSILGPPVEVASVLFNPRKGPHWIVL